jgi:hypothetical protein
MTASEERLSRDERVHERRRGGEAQAQGQGPLFSERSERERAEPSAKK